MDTTSLYSLVLKPLLFQLDPECAHHLTLTLARGANNALVHGILRKIFRCEDSRLEVKVAGLTFPNPIGLAAGMDKNCEALGLFDGLGFGALELGTITAYPQPGNPKPRMFRLPQDRALINRMGFPSGGAEVAAAQLAKTPRDRYRAIVGINIGKTKATPLDAAESDYQFSFERLRNLGDYFVVNVSSPNTPDLRKLQEPGRLRAIFRGLHTLNSQGKPIFVKVAPDLSEAELDDILEVVLSEKIAGIIATNTTLSREGISTVITEGGGLSGKPLRGRALSMIRYVAKKTERKIPIIGVGGISSVSDVIETMRSGASLVQIYTSLVYEGPSLVCRINRGILDFLERERISSISSIIGADLNTQ